jgi:integrase
MRLMHWDDVDLETGWWTIPAEVAKNGLAHRVPLSAPAQDVLRALQEETGSTSWVFPSPRRRGKPFINIRKSAVFPRSSIMLSLASPASTTAIPTMPKSARL